MTQKHFEKIAKIISMLQADNFGRLTIQSIAEQFADELALTNPKFDREKFIKACL